MIAVTVSSPGPASTVVLAPDVTLIVSLPLPPRIEGAHAAALQVVVAVAAEDRVDAAAAVDRVVAGAAVEVVAAAAWPRRRRVSWSWSPQITSSPARPEILSEPCWPRRLSLRSVPRSVPPWAPTEALMPLVGSTGGACAMTVSQLTIRPSRSAWSLETPPGAPRGLT